MIPGKSKITATLRQEALEHLNEKLVGLRGAHHGISSEDDILKLIHELEVHQIELERQNEELIREKQQAESASDKYAELFDFAPSGYFTVSREGEISELNLQGSHMLGEPRSGLQNRRFGLFVSHETRSTFNLFLERVFQSKRKESCEVIFISDDNPPVNAFLSGIVANNGNHCLITAMDTTELRQSEKSLKESEEKYRLLADHMSDVIWLMDLDFKVSYQSPSSEKLRGFNSEEIMNLPMEKNLTPESLQFALGELQSVLPRIINDPDYNPVTQMELEYYRKDGTTVWLENKYSIIRNAEDKSITILGEGRDITDRRRAEDTNKRLLSLLAATFDSIHNGILVVNFEGNVIKTNATFAKMWRIPEGVIASGDDKILLDYVMDQLSDPGEFIAKVKELYGKPESDTFDQVNFKDGRVFERISKPMYLDGRPEGRVWSFLDITNRKLAEDALLEKRWRLENIIEATRVGTWEWNVQTDALAINNRWAQMIGYTLEELAPISIKTWQNLVHPDDLEISDRLLKQHFSSTLPYYSVECRLKHKDGHWVWALVRGCLMARTTEGKPLMMFGTHADISDRKKADAEIEVKNAQLILANMEKDKFFSIIAHDLRSPFNGFLGFSQMLADDVDSMSIEDIREIALLMRRSAVNVFSLLENLLEWSRINRGITAYEPKQLFLASSVTEAITSIAESAVKKGVNISLDIPEEVQVFADEYMLASIIRNLTSNALKFTHHGGIITISVSVTTGDSATISIRDTGIGMKKEMLPNLFRYDLQTNRKGTEGEPSSGLGLIICKEFIEKHGGKFWVESEEGKGSCFSFSIPSQ